MSAERALKNIHRMRDMRVTGDEAQWILGAISGTVLMTVALDRLAERRANEGWTDHLSGAERLHLAEKADNDGVYTEALDRLTGHYAEETAS